MATVRKLKSGKWNAQVRRKGHSPISKSFTFEKDAYVWIRSIESGFTPFLRTVWLSLNPASDAFPAVAVFAGYGI
ncbi:hypothetical protein C8R21_1681, partial [Nitrosospira multiformis]